MCSRIGRYFTKTLKEIKYFCGNSNTDIIGIDMDSVDMHTLLGKKVVVAAVIDFGFGKRFSELGTLIQGRTKRTSKKTTMNRRFCVYID